MVIVGVVGLVSIVGFLVWVVFREPWGPLRAGPHDLRAEADRRRRMLAARRARGLFLRGVAQRWSRLRQPSPPTARDPVSAREESR